MPGVNLTYSFIIAVYERKDELLLLLESIEQQRLSPLEVIVVDDGSSTPLKEQIKELENRCKYIYQENAGAAVARNTGMKIAQGDYFIFIDSDCVLPLDYLKAVDTFLGENRVDAFGGPDKAMSSFTFLQKAINYAMTSFLSTGGIRGGGEQLGKFQLRSFNMGISKEVFQLTQGFSKQRVGEDIDFSMRIWSAGFKSALIKEAFVYHKRRATLFSFFKQVHSFGRMRPLLNAKYPNYSKGVFVLPSLFSLGLIIALIMLVQFPYVVGIYLLYALMVLVDATYRNKSLQVGFLSIITVIGQHVGYGVGYLRGLISTSMKKKN